MVGGCRRVDSACGNEANACRLQGGRRAGARSAARRSASRNMWLRTGRALRRRSNWRSGSPPCDAEQLRRVAGAPAYRPVRSRASDGEPDEGGRYERDAKMRIQDFLQITRCHGVPSRAGAADAALRYRGLTPRDPVVRVQDAKFEACRIGLLAGSVHARTFGVAERCWTKSLRLFATTLTRAKLSRSVSYAPMRPLQRI